MNLQRLRTQQRNAVATSMDAGGGIPEQNRIQDSRHRPFLGKVEALVNARRLGSDGRRVGESVYSTTFDVLLIFQQPWKFLDH